MTENESTTDSVEVAAEVEAENFDLTATLTADLQRLQAEYSNYRKRVERDRAVASEIAVASVLSELLSTLDDIDRASQHGELSGGFKSVADLKKLLEGADYEGIKNATTKVAELSQALGAALYAANAASAPQGGGSSNDEGIQDAEVVEE